MPSIIDHFYTSSATKVIYAIDNSCPLVSLQLYIKTGSGIEGKDEAGYAHFLEHLVFKSTLHYPRNSLMDRVAMLGGNINAFTDHEVTCFYINLPSHQLNEGIVILSELAVNADFSSFDFESEKKVVIEEIKQCKNDPEDYFIDNITALVFENHPYGRPILGNISSLRRAKSKTLWAFYKKHYTAENAFLVVAGDVTIERLKEACENLNLPNTAPTPSIPPALPQYKYITHDQVVHFRLSIEYDMLAFILPSPADSHPDAHKLNCLDKIFMWGRNSRLYQRLFIREKLIDSLKVQSITGIYSGALVVLIQPRQNEYINRIVEIFFEEMQNIVRFGVKRAEVDEAKADLLHTCRYGFEFMESLAQTIAAEEILGDYHSFFDYETQIQAINKESINSLIAEYYDLQKLNIIVGGDYNSPLLEGCLQSRRGVANNIRPQGRSKFISSDIGDYFDLTLPNNLRLFLKQTPSKGICGITLALYVSQLDEDIHTLGLNQLTSNTLLYGNEKRDYRQCLQYCSQSGIQLSVSNGKETTRLRGKCFSDNLWESLDLLHDVLYTPTFPTHHIENLRQSYISSIKKVSDFPQSEAVIRFRQMLFGKDSHLLSKTGSLRTLKTFSKKQITQWYQHKILGTPATLCIVGDIDIEKTLQYIQKLFCEASFGRDIHHRPIFLTPSEKSIIKDYRGNDQSIISLGGFCMPGKDIALRAPMNILSQIIGGEISSRMFSLLREKHAIAYSADFDYDLLTDIGYFDMFTIVNKKSTKMAVKLLYELLDDLQTNGVTEAELSHAKNYIIGQRILDEESVLLQAQVIATLLTLGMDYEYISNRATAISAVTTSEIQSVLNEYFCGSDLYLHILQ